ncbi:hypothetical protein BLNAU_22362 [Blattamonas nauphoetae]|uniref:HECT domain-containing protein n=1 Tax=Blattamonas nauphoetae TaxID=2049346 RepID=A0ABQ9WTA8_9EUKA|nr:hypothetical protein BLNAU_22362 [Blattamonas nauphoetae]
MGAAPSVPLEDQVLQQVNSLGILSPDVLDHFNPTASFRHSEKSTVPSSDHFIANPSFYLSNEYLLDSSLQDSFNTSVFAPSDIDPPYISSEDEKKGYLFQYVGLILRKQLLQQSELSSQTKRPIILSDDHALENLNNISLNFSAQLVSSLGQNSPATVQSVLSSILDTLERFGPNSFSELNPSVLDDIESIIQSTQFPSYPAYLTHLNLLLKLYLVSGRARYVLHLANALIRPPTQFSEPLNNTIQESQPLIKRFFSSLTIAWNSLHPFHIVPLGSHNTPVHELKLNPGETPEFLKSKPAVIGFVSTTSFLILLYDSGIIAQYGTGNDGTQKGKLYTALSLIPKEELNQFTTEELYPTIFPISKTTFGFSYVCRLFMRAARPCLLILETDGFAIRQSFYPKTDDPNAPNQTDVVAFPSSLFVTHVLSGYSPLLKSYIRSLNPAIWKSIATVQQPQVGQLSSTAHPLNIPTPSPIPQPSPSPDLEDNFDEESPEEENLDDVTRADLFLDKLLFSSTKSAQPKTRAETPIPQAILPIPIVQEPNPVTQEEIDFHHSCRDSYINSIPSNIRPDANADSLDIQIWAKSTEKCYARAFSDSIHYYVLLMYGTLDTCAEIALLLVYSLSDLTKIHNWHLIDLRCIGILKECYLCNRTLSFDTTRQCVSCVRDSPQASFFCVDCIKNGRAMIYHPPTHETTALRVNNQNTLTIRTLLKANIFCNTNCLVLCGTHQPDVKLFDQIYTFKLVNPCQIDFENDNFETDPLLSRLETISKMSRSITSLAHYSSSTHLISFFNPNSNEYSSITPETPPPFSLSPFLITKLDLRQLNPKSILDEDGTIPLVNRLKIAESLLALSSTQCIIHQSSLTKASFDAYSGLFQFLSVDVDQPFFTAASTLLLAFADEITKYEPPSPDLLRVFLNFISIVTTNVAFLFKAPFTHTSLGFTSEIQKSFDSGFNRIQSHLSKLIDSKVLTNNDQVLLRTIDREVLVLKIRLQMTKSDQNDLLSTISQSVLPLIANKTDSEQLVSFLSILQTSLGNNFKQLLLSMLSPSTLAKTSLNHYAQSVPTNSKALFIIWEFILLALDACSREQVSGKEGNVETAKLTSSVVAEVEQSLFAMFVRMHEEKSKDSHTHHPRVDAADFDVAFHPVYPFLSHFLVLLLNSADSFLAFFTESLSTIENNSMSDRLFKEKVTRLKESYIGTHVQPALSFIEMINTSPTLASDLLPSLLRLSKSYSSFVGVLKQKSEKSTILTAEQEKVMELAGFTTDILSTLPEHNSFEPAWVVFLRGTRPSPVDSSSVKFETTHPYKNNENRHVLISRPGSNGYIVRFDPRCKTERSCDYLLFHQVEVKNGQKMKGNRMHRYDGKSFPKELKIDQKEFYIGFQSDSSGVDWGVLVHIDPIIPKATIRPEWVISMDSQIAHAIEPLHKALANAATSKSHLKVKTTIEAERKDVFVTNDSIHLLRKTCGSGISEVFCDTLENKLFGGEEEGKEGEVTRQAAYATLMSISEAQLGTTLSALALSFIQTTFTSGPLALLSSLLSVNQSDHEHHLVEFFWSRMTPMGLSTKAMGVGKVMIGYLFAALLSFTNEECLDFVTALSESVRQKKAEWNGSSHQERLVTDVWKAASTLLSTLCRSAVGHGSSAYSKLLQEARNRSSLMLLRANFVGSQNGQTGRKPKLADAVSMMISISASQLVRTVLGNQSSSLLCIFAGVSLLADLALLQSTSSIAPIIADLVLAPSLSTTLLSSANQLTETLLKRILHIIDQYISPNSPKSQSIFVLRKLATLLTVFGRLSILTNYNVDFTKSDTKDLLSRLGLLLNSDSFVLNEAVWVKSVILSLFKILVLSSNNPSEAISSILPLISQSLATNIDAFVSNQIVRTAAIRQRLGLDKSEPAKTTNVALPTVIADTFIVRLLSLLNIFFSKFNGFSSKCVSDSLTTSVVNCVLFGTDSIQHASISLLEKFITCLDPSQLLTIFTHNVTILDCLLLISSLTLHSAHSTLPSSTPHQHTTPISLLRQKVLLCIDNSIQSKLKEHIAQPDILLDVKLYFTMCLPNFAYLVQPAFNLSPLIMQQLEHLRKRFLLTCPPQLANTWESLSMKDGNIIATKIDPRSVIDTDLKYSDTASEVNRMILEVCLSQFMPSQTGVHQLSNSAETTAAIHSLLRKILNGTIENQHKHATVWSRTVSELAKQSICHLPTLMTQTFTWLDEGNTTPSPTYTLNEETIQSLVNGETFLQILTGSNLNFLRVGARIKHTPSGKTGRVVRYSQNDAIVTAVLENGNGRPENLSVKTVSVVDSLEVVQQAKNNALQTLLGDSQVVKSVLSLITLFKINGSHFDRIQTESQSEIEQHFALGASVVVSALRLHALSFVEQIDFTETMMSDSSLLNVMRDVVEIASSGVLSISPESISSLINFLNVRLSSHGFSQPREGPQSSPSSLSFVDTGVKEWNTSFSDSCTTSLFAYCQTCFTLMPVVCFCQRPVVSRHSVRGRKMWCASCKSWNEMKSNVSCSCSRRSSNHQFTYFFALINKNEFSTLQKHLKDTKTHLLLTALYCEETSVLRLPKVGKDYLEMGKDGRLIVPSTKNEIDASQFEHPKLPYDPAEIWEAKTERVGKNKQPKPKKAKHDSSDDDSSSEDAAPDEWARARDDQTLAPVNALPPTPFTPPERTTWRKLVVYSTSEKLKRFSDPFPANKFIQKRAAIFDNPLRTKTLELIQEANANRQTGEEDDVIADALSVDRNLEIVESLMKPDSLRTFKSEASLAPILGITQTTHPALIASFIHLLNVKPGDRVLVVSEDVLTLGQSFSKAASPGGFVLNLIQSDPDVFSEITSTHISKQKWQIEPFTNEEQTLFASKKGAEKWKYSFDRMKSEKMMPNTFVALGTPFVLSSQMFEFDKILLLVNHSPQHLLQSLQLLSRKEDSLILCPDLALNSFVLLKHKAENLSAESARFVRKGWMPFKPASNLLSLPTKDSLWTCSSEDATSAVLSLTEKQVLFKTEEIKKLVVVTLPVEAPKPFNLDSAETVWSVIHAMQVGICNSFAASHQLKDQRANSVVEKKEAALQTQPEAQNTILFPSKETPTESRFTVQPFFAVTCCFSDNEGVCATCLSRCHHHRPSSEKTGPVTQSIHTFQTLSYCDCSFLEDHESKYTCNCQNIAEIPSSFFVSSSPFPKPAEHKEGTPFVGETMWICPEMEIFAPHFMNVEKAKALLAQKKVIVYMGVMTAELYAHLHALPPPDSEVTGIQHYLQPQKTVISGLDQPTVPVVSTKFDHLKDGIALLLTTRGVTNKLAAVRESEFMRLKPKSTPEPAKTETKQKRRRTAPTQQEKPSHDEESESSIEEIITSKAHDLSGRRKDATPDSRTGEHESSETDEDEEEGSEDDSDNDDLAGMMDGADEIDPASLALIQALLRAEMRGEELEDSDDSDADSDSDDDDEPGEDDADAEGQDLSTESDSSDDHRHQRRPVPKSKRFRMFSTRGRGLFGGSDTDSSSGPDLMELLRMAASQAHSLGGGDSDDSSDSSSDSTSDALEDLFARLRQGARRPPSPQRQDSHPVMTPSSTSSSSDSSSDSESESSGSEDTSDTSVSIKVQTRRKIQMKRDLQFGVPFETGDRMVSNKTVTRKMIVTAPETGPRQIGAKQQLQLNEKELRNLRRMRQFEKKKDEKKEKEEDKESEPLPPDQPDIFTRFHNHSLLDQTTPPRLADPSPTVSDPSQNQSPTQNLRTQVLEEMDMLLSNEEIPDEDEGKDKFKAAYAAWKEKRDQQRRRAAQRAADESDSDSPSSSDDDSDDLDVADSTALVKLLLQLGAKSAQVSSVEIQRQLDIQAKMDQSKRGMVPFTVDVKDVKDAVVDVASLGPMFSGAAPSTSEFISCVVVGEKDGFVHVLAVDPLHSQHSILVLPSSAIKRPAVPISQVLFPTAPLTGKSEIAQKNELFEMKIIGQSAAQLRASKNFVISLIQNADCSRRLLEGACSERQVIQFFVNLLSKTLFFINDPDSFRISDKQFASNVVETTFKADKTRPKGKDETLILVTRAILAWMVKDLKEGRAGVQLLSFLSSDAEDWIEENPDEAANIPPFGSSNFSLLIRSLIEFMSSPTRLVQSLTQTESQSFKVLIPSPNSLSFDTSVQPSLDCHSLPLTSLSSFNPSVNPEIYIRESTHPYDNGITTDEIITIQTGSGFQVSFDPACRTESGPDKLTFTNDETGVVIKEFTGQNFHDFEAPGCTRVKVAFESDRSVNDWGYRFVMRAINQQASEQDEVAWIDIVNTLNENTTDSSNTDQTDLILGQLEYQFWIVQTLLLLPLSVRLSFDNTRVVWLDLVGLIKPLLRIVSSMKSSHPLFRFFVHALNSVVLRWMNCHSITSRAARSPSITSFPAASIVESVSSFGMDEDDAEKSSVVVSLLEMKHTLISAISLYHSLKDFSTATDPTPTQIQKFTKTEKIPDTAFTRPICLLTSYNSTIFSFHALNEIVTGLLTPTRMVSPMAIAHVVAMSAIVNHYSTPHPYTAAGYSLKFQSPVQSAIVVSLKPNFKIDTANGHKFQAMSGFDGTLPPANIDQPDRQLHIHSRDVQVTLITKGSEPAPDKNFGADFTIRVGIKDKDHASMSELKAKLLPTIRRIVEIFSDRKVWTVDLDTALVELVNRVSRRTKLPFLEIPLTSLLEEAVAGMEIVDEGSSPTPSEGGSADPSGPITSIGRSHSPTPQAPRARGPTGHLSPGIIAPVGLSPSSVSGPFLVPPQSHRRSPGASSFTNRSRSPAPIIARGANESFAKFVPQSSDPLQQILQLTSDIPAFSPFAHLPLSSCTLYEAEEEKKDETAGIADPLTIHPLKVRHDMLNNLNGDLVSLFDVLPFSSFFSSLSFLPSLQSFRYLLYLQTKQLFWNVLIHNSYSPSRRPEVTVNRTIRNIGNRVKHSLFYQMMIALGPHIASGVIKQSERAFLVNFMGEGSIDQGGPYRECLSDIASELQEEENGQEGNKTRRSPRNKLPVLRPTQNHLDQVGLDNDCFVLNVSNDENEWAKGTPSPRGFGDVNRRTEQTHMPQTKIQMLRFLGTMMGIHILTKNPMNIILSRAIWKHIVAQPVSLGDVTRMDEQFTKSLTAIRKCSDEEEFEAYEVEWSVMASDGELVALTAPHSLTGFNPSSISADSPFPKVSFSDRFAYCTAAERFKLNEFSAEAAEVRRGIEAVVPTELLTLATGAELEFLVCGDASVTVDDLKRIHKFTDSYRDAEKQKMFWEAMELMTNEQRQSYLRFVTGRTRLPPHNGPVPESLVIRVSDYRATNADMFLPVSHTCNQSLELPLYSSVQVMRSKIVYAATNCVSIDTDGGGGGGGFEIQDDSDTE